MSPTNFTWGHLLRSPVSAVRCGSLALALMLVGSSVRSATPVPDAPTVAPAPMVDKPLSPAASDTPGEQPTPQHVWVPGHWRWQEGAYVWESGRWEIPPTPSVSWVPPEWQKQANGYVLKEGYWSEAPPAPPVAAAAQPPQEIYTTQPPPPPQSEVIYERPSPVHIWVGGYWGWRLGRHVWRGGHGELPPRPRVVWVPAHWEFRGGR